MRIFSFCFTVFFLSCSAAHAADITEHDLLGHIKILASDDFGGRKPGTEGENKTVNYIATQWKNAGLLPASENDNWYAPVAMIDRIPVSQEIAFILQGKRAKRIKVGKDQIVLRGAAAENQLANMPIVHAGYGSANIEDMRPFVSGKIAFLFASSPSGSTDSPAFRERKANLIAAGASGVIAIIKGESRWKRDARRFRSVSASLADKNSHAIVEGIISADAAEKIFRKGDVDVKNLDEDIEHTEFQPVLVPILANLSVKTQLRNYVSNNVIGKIAGRKPKTGAVLFLGHWDHFGDCEPESLGDRICNGAVDNASGISLLIETAKRLAKISLDRDIYFLATTAEEQGLLGASAFVAHPSFALNRLVAVFNADTVALAPDGKLIAVVGHGETDLDEDLGKVAKAEGREIDTTGTSDKFLKRQDGYIFLKMGIPSFMITSAFADQERLDAYIAGRYHDVSDEADDGLILGGAAADANFHVALGHYFGNIATYPLKGPSD
ncbi:MAG: M28 family peptidase [Parasphingorhabdus sp.]|uniref:M28 family peptidase n=1 Tax=Parasphingorhabdus sp. TaxID=2709688 RepID=UPI003001E970